MAALTQSAIGAPHSKTQIAVERISGHGYIIATCTSSLLKELFNDERASKESVILHDAKAITLHGYVYWLHTRKLLSRKGAEFRSYAELIDFYVLGETDNDLTFCKEVVEAMVAMRYEVRKAPGWRVTNDAWEKTSPDSPLRMVIKELWVFMHVEEAIKLLKAMPEPGYPKDLILCLLDMLAERSISVTHATFSGKSRKEVEAAYRGFVKGNNAKAVTCNFLHGSN